MHGPRQQTRALRRRTFDALLSAELESRMKKNPQYSLRAFARDLGIAASRLSDILRRRRGLSQMTIAKIAAKLDLPDDQTLYYSLQARLANTKDSTKKKLIRSELEALERRLDFVPIPSSTDGSAPRITSWLHFTVLEALDLPDFELTPEWISARFGCEKAEASKVIMELVDAGTIQFDNGRPARVSEMMRSAPVSRGDLLSRRREYSEVVELARDSILYGEIGTFLSTSQYMALPESAMVRLKEFITELKEQSAKLALETNRREKVYCLNINLFPVEKFKPPKK